MSKKFFGYFPPPRFLEFPYIGINITPRAVRFIELVKAKHGFQVGRFAEKKLKTYNPNVPLKENKELIAILQELQREYGLSFVESALPEEKAYLFKTEVPNKSDTEIRNNIEFHLEENVPLTLEESIFDYHVIEEPLRDKDQKVAIKSTNKVTVSVLPVSVVEEYIELFKEARLTPISFLIESQAIAKAVIKKGDLGTYLIVNLDDTKTELSIVSKDSVQFTSSLPVGADDFTSAIIKQFNVTIDEAKKMKKEKGFVKDKNNPDLFFAMINTASLLKDEIERIYTYWHTHTEKGETGREKIRKILFTGEDAALIGFKEYLAQAVRVETEIANVWVNTFTFEEYIPPIEFSDSLKYSAAIGLALPKL